ESCLRAIRSREVSVSGATVELLMEGAGLLEQVIGARRDGRPGPPVDAIVDRLALRVAQERQGAGPTHGPSPVGAPVAEPPLSERGGQWLVSYTPTPALASRGINVNTVRATLQAAGRIIEASPLVTPEGGILFQFVVEADVDDAELHRWRADGLTVVPHHLDGESLA